MLDPERKGREIRRVIEEALLIMRNLKCKVYDDEILVTEPNKRQNEISSLLNIIMPKKYGI